MYRALGTAWIQGVAPVAGGPQACAPCGEGAERFPYCLAVPSVPPILGFLRACRYCEFPLNHGKCAEYQ